MSRTLPATTLLLAALLIAACRPAPEAAPAADAPAAATRAASPGTTPPTAAPGTDAQLVSDETSPAGDPDFDVRAFAGRFEGTLPCPDCAGTGTTLDLHPDGRYLKRDSDGNADVDTGGTWTVDAEGRRLHLDPDDKGREDRVYAIVSTDALQAIGSDGRPAIPAALLRRRSGT